MMSNILKLIFWRYLKSVTANLPVSVMSAGAGIAGYLQMLILKKRRRITADELLSSRLSDRKHLKRTVYRSFKTQLLSWLKMCYLSEINDENVNHFFQVDGLEHLDKALESGRGAILLNPHFGPFLFIMPALGYRGYILNQVTLQSEPIIGKRKGLERNVYEATFNAIERNMPVTFINAAGHAMAMRDVIKKLGQNEIVIFASTGRGGKTWCDVDFLGRNACFNLTPFRIAMKRGATLLPAFVLDSKPLARVIIDKPLQIVDGDMPEDILRRYSVILSKYVERYPDHFAFFLYDMHRKAWWDDHPFFPDYSAVQTKQTRKSVMS